jgi:hypothetical protein
MTNLGGTFRTLDNVDGRCELEQGILSQVREFTLLFLCARGVVWAIQEWVNGR